MKKVTVRGMYTYDPEILDKMHLPMSKKGFTFVCATSEILRLCGHFEPIVTNPRIFKTLVHDWALINCENWTRMLDTYEAEYNPIENYDRSEEWTNESTQSGNSNAEGNSNSIESRAAYNTDSLTNSSKNEVAGNDSQSFSSASKRTHAAHIHGNIGVTTTQEMINQELELRKFNIATYIAEEFKKEFCILVY